MANNNKDNKKHLYYLDELSDYKVASDDPDVRGWEVKDADNKVVGKVDNLLVNKEREKVVYLDVEVDKSIIDANHEPYGKSASGAHEFINKEGENHLIIPVGHAKLNEDDKYVYTDRIDHRTFAETKRKERGANVDREYEVVVLDSYNRERPEAETRTRTSTERATTNDNVEGRTTESRVTDKEVRDAKTTDRTTDRNVEGRRTSENRAEEDDTFYEREDFDRSNYRQKR